MREKTKDERIKAEERRLTKIYGDLKSDKKMKAAQGLIRRAAYMRIMLEECESDIVENGLTEKFSQGDQEPYDRKRPIADLYSAMNTSYQKITKQLTDLLPTEEKKEADPFLDYIVGGDSG
jgi:hypothetical protein